MHEAGLALVVFVSWFLVEFWDATEGLDVWVQEGR